MRVLYNTNGVLRKKILKNRRVLPKLFTKKNYNLSKESRRFLESLGFKVVI